MDALEQALSNLQDAQNTLEEVNECGTLEDRLDAAYEVEQAQRRLAKARIDFYK